VTRSSGIKQRSDNEMKLFHRRPSSRTTRRGFVQAVRRVTCPSAIGAGLAEIGLILASFSSSFSIFFCSWETGWLVAGMFIFSHDPWAL
jgi:hypothetical protein